MHDRNSARYRPSAPELLWPEYQESEGTSVHAPGSTPQSGKSAPSKVTPDHPSGRVAALDQLNGYPASGSWPDGRSDVTPKGRIWRNSHESSFPFFHMRRPTLRLPAGMPAHVAITVALLVLLFGATFSYGLSGAEGYNAPQLLARLKAPSFGLSPSDHWLGTDQIGRDILLRCLKGIQVSVGISLAGVIGGCVIGSTLGLVCGYFGGWIDRLGMMLVDMQLALPNLLLILTGIALFGSNIVVLIVLISLARWEGYARLVRGMVLKTREQEFVEAARAIGASAPRILFIHILPNIASPLFVMVTLSLPSVMLLEASLSFIGIGVQPPTPSLGRMVADGRDFLATHPWISLAPAALIAFITFAGQVAADWGRARLDMKAMS